MAFLLEIKGLTPGTRYDLDKDATTLGRRSENEVPVESAAVSGRHLVILREGPRFRLRDLDSTNGTLLNGAPVRETMLAHHDVIRVGEIEFEFNDPSWAEITPDKDAASRLPPTVGVKPASQRIPTSFQNASPFGTRRDFSNFWMVLIILGALACIGLGAFFMYLFFRG
jgi:pSer/pThr/pTyr-binding forkhead associated (FHA) protein